MDKSNFAFSKSNYILLVVGIAIIITGFILMSGDGSTEEAFNPDIFSDMRIKVAPMVSLFGFIFVIFAILWHPCGKCRNEAAKENCDVELGATSTAAHA